jgi:hypothetical protein
MIPAIVISFAVLWAFVRAGRRWGFQNVMEWAGMVFLAIPAFALVGVIAVSTIQGASFETPSMMIRIALGSATVLVVWLVAKKAGWGNLLGWLFSVSLVVCGVVLVALIFYSMFAMAHGAY